MKLQILSDLHLEFGGPMPKPAPDADVLVLAGDIAVGVDAFPLLENWPVPVVYVAGNHEFYGGPIYRTTEAMQRFSNESKNVWFLDNRAAFLCGARFLGTTLWTDYRLDMPKTSREEAMRLADEHMYDHRAIKMGSGRFLASDALASNHHDAMFLDVRLDDFFDGPTVVVTHHAPSRKSIHPKYESSKMNSAFASNFDHLVEKADLWIHGHVHSTFGYSIGKCRVIVNPRGYPLRAGGFENPEFNESLTIEIGGSA